MVLSPGSTIASALVLAAALGGGPAAAQSLVPEGPVPPAIARPVPPPPPRPATAASPATKKPPAGKRVKRPRWPTVVLFHVNRRETMYLRIADEQGRPVRGVQRRVERFLRCHKTNTQHAMNPRLTRLIYETGRHYPGKRIEIISGYRHPAVARNPRSPHMKGLACDMRVDGVKNTELRDFFRRTFKHVGVGYYPNSSFVHLDVRRGLSAFWIDYSGPGDNAMYAENPNDDLKTGRADTFKPAKIDPSWAEQDGETPPETAGLAAGARPAAAPAAVP